MIKKLLLCLCLSFLLLAACASPATDSLVEANESGTVIEVLKAPS